MKLSRSTITTSETRKDEYTTPEQEMITSGLVLPALSDLPFLLEVNGPYAFLSHPRFWLVARRHRSPDKNISLIKQY
jgi:hypothetical protein